MNAKTDSEKTSDVDNDITESGEVIIKKLPDISGRELKFLLSRDWFHLSYLQFSEQLGFRSAYPVKAWRVMKKVPPKVVIKLIELNDYLFYLGHAEWQNISEKEKKLWEL